MQMFKRMLQSCGQKVKSYISQKWDYFFNRKKILKTLRVCIRTILLSIALTLCPDLNAGVKLSLIIIWGSAKYQILFLIAVTVILIPLSIYDWYKENNVSI